MKAGFIGAGKVGFSLGKYFTLGDIPVTGYYSHNPASAREAAEFTGTRFYDQLAQITEDSDTLFLTVPDGKIQEVWEVLRNLPIKNKKICHCSGSLSSAAFFDAENLGAFRYSVHPLYAVSDKYHSFSQLKNAYFTIEGSPEHLAEMTETFHSLGNPVVNIAENTKSLYHCAAAVVSNQMTALAELGIRMLISCGFERDDALHALAPLMLGNLEAVCSRGPADALTGPVERCDTQTILKHLSAIRGFENRTKEHAAVSASENSADIEALYRQLSLLLTEIAAEKHPTRDFTSMKEILHQETSK